MAKADLIISFETQNWLKFVYVLFLFFGILILTLVYKDFASQTAQQVQATYIITPIISAIFIGVPIYSFIYMRTVIRDKGTWIIDYPYQKKTIKFYRNDTDKVEILENINGRYAPIYEIITIWTKEKKEIKFSSLEIASYEKFKKLLMRDFGGKVVVKQFGKTKPRQ